MLSQHIQGGVKTSDIFHTNHLRIPILSSELLHFHGAGHPYFSLSAMAFDLVLFLICLSVFQNCRLGQRFRQKAIPTANLAGIKTGIPITKGDQAARGGGTAGFTVSTFLTD